MLTPTAYPPLRVEAAGVAIDDGVLVQGGFSVVEGFLADMWLLTEEQGSHSEQSVWTQLLATPPSNTSASVVTPQGRSGHTLDILGTVPANTTSGTLLLHGGHDIVTGYTPLNDTWQWDLLQERWAVVPVDAASTVSAAALPRAYHLSGTLAGGQVLLHGGQGLPEGTGEDRTSRDRMLSAFPLPGHAHGARAVGSVVLRGDAITCVPTVDGSCIWHAVNTSGAEGRPQARSHHAGAVLQLADCDALVVHGGVIGPHSTTNHSAGLALASDTWLLVLPRTSGASGVRDSFAGVWHRLTPPVSPSKRWAHAASAVSATRIVLSGGLSNDAVLDDVWLLDVTVTAAGTHIAASWMQLKDSVRSWAGLNGIAFCSPCATQLPLSLPLAFP